MFGLSLEATILLGGGLVILLVNIIYGLIRTMRGQVRAGWFTVGLALLACIMITFGSINIASASGAANTRTPARTGRTGGRPTPTVEAGIVPTDASADPSPISPTNTPSPAATAIGTRRANAGQGGGTGSGGVRPVSNLTNPAPNANAPVAPTAPTASATTPSNNLGMQIILAGSALCVIAALILYFMERRRNGFAANTSRGLLDLGAGLFMGLAVLIIPMIPGQLAGAGQVSVSQFPRGTVGAPTRAALTATPTATQPPTNTATPLPTLTLTPTATVFASPTSINYAKAQGATVATTSPNLDLAKANAPIANTTCNVSATNNLNLRGDPSTANPLLLTIPAGTTLPVSATTKDKSWWKVSYNDGAKTTIGWVSAQYATPISKCTTVPVSAG
jgi:hypothetical protein